MRRTALVFLVALVAGCSATLDATTSPSDLATAAASPALTSNAPAQSTSPTPTATASPSPLPVTPSPAASSASDTNLLDPRVIRSVPADTWLMAQDGSRVAYVGRNTATCCLLTLRPSQLRPLTVTHPWMGTSFPSTSVATLSFGQPARGNTRTRAASLAVPEAQSSGPSGPAT